MNAFRCFSLTVDNHLIPVAAFIAKTSKNAPQAFANQVFDSQIATD